ncbi:MAG: DNA mismatch repair protein MutS [Selenomonadaceae bacterium]|nr:DNA mismatch repair protein MutS [Selenomonadaceae bacterium]MBR1860227.1 DNA mismatch repair protein MutS [Selenomonadaceae bacterium]
MDRKFYDNEREIDLAEQKILHKRSRKIVAIRMVIFLLMLFSFAAGYDNIFNYGYECAALLFLIFLRLVKYHETNKRRQQFLKSRLSVLNSYISRAGGTWRKRSNNGSNYLKDEYPQYTDLHVFGAGSIFQYICAARTKRGRDRLAESLSPMPPADFKAVRFRQKGVSELLTRPRLSLDLEAYSRLMPNNHDTTKLIEAVEEELPKVSFVLNLRFVFLPLLIIVALLTYYGVIDNIILITALPILYLTIAVVFLRKTNEVLNPLRTISKELRLYRAIFGRLEETEFNSECLSKIRAAFTDEISASEELNRLSLLVEVVSTRRNPMFFILGNALFLMDFYCVWAFLKMRKNAAKHLRAWIDAWSEMEVLMSLASIGQTRTTFCFPQLIDDETPHVEAKQLTSLLIADKKAVANDVKLNAGTTIITGSNMSGKTTWIRTLTSSVLLAYAGAPVCAESFSVSRMSIFTSIRVNDDISQGLSTFYAELLRIKSMIEFSQNKKPMLICIDEIFKGTNSADRIVGAKEAIRHLTNEWSITLVTTHDFELCDLTSKNNTPVTNAHFEEYYEGDEIRFDFKLRDGRCHTTNAKYLLKMAGII